MRIVTLAAGWIVTLVGFEVVHTVFLWFVAHGTHCRLATGGYRFIFGGVIRVAAITAKVFLLMDAAFPVLARVILVAAQALLSTGVLGRVQRVQRQ